MMRPPSGWLGRAPSDRESYIPYNYSYQTSPHARYPPFCSTCCCDGFFAGRGDGVFSDRVGLFTGDVVTSSGLFIRVPSSGAPSVSSQMCFGGCAGGVVCGYGETGAEEADTGHRSIAAAIPRRMGRAGARGPTIVMQRRELGSSGVRQSVGETPV